MTDTYANYVSLLLPFDGPTTADSFCIHDYSKYYHPFVLNSTSKVSTNLFKFYGMSLVNNPGGALFKSSVSTSHDAFKFYLNDFTVEMWVYLKSAPQSNQVLISFCSYPNTTGFWISYNNSGTVSVKYGSATVITSSTSNLSMNTGWNHLAVVRRSGIFYIYIDGSVANTPVTNNTLSFSDGVCILGRPSDTTSNAAYANLQDLRVTNGVARYTTNFIPPTQLISITRPERYYLSTMLFPFSTNSGVFSIRESRSNSSNSITKINKAFGITCDYTTKKFNYANSFKFDGDSYIVVDDVTEYMFGSKNFTFECWFSKPDTTSGALIGKGTYSGTSTQNFCIVVSSTGLTIYYTYSSYYSISYPFSTNTWYHIVLQNYSAGFHEVYVNGVCVYVKNNTFPDVSDKLSIGNFYNNYIGYTFYGNMQDLMITQNNLVYNSKMFTEPSSFKGNGANDPKFDKVILQLPLDSWTDESTNTKTTTVNGNLTQSSTQKKFYSSSAYFDGSGDYLAISTSSDFDFASSDFTIECWVYVSDFSVHRGIFGFSAAYRIQCLIQASTGKLIIYASSNGTSWDIFSVVGGRSISINTWTHIAFCRSGNIWTSYVDGKPDACYIGSESIKTNNSAVLCIGYSPHGSYYYKGYMQDFRITKGASRYENALAIPTEQFDNLTDDTVDTYSKTYSALDYQKIFQTQNFNSKYESAPLKKISNVSPTTPYRIRDNLPKFISIIGYVQKEGVSGSYSVRIYNRTSGLLVDIKNSNVDGSFLFTNLQYYQNNTYYAVAVDENNNQYDAKIVDFITGDDDDLLINIENQSIYVSGQSLKGNVTASLNTAISLIAIHKWGSKELVGVLKSINGSWEYTVLPGAYQVTYYTECCAPVCYGPYYVN